MKEIYLRYLSRNLDRISFSSKRNVTPSRSISKTHFSSLVCKLLASFRNVWRCGRGRGRRRGRCTHATVANFIIYIHIYWQYRGGNWACSPGICQILFTTTTRCDARRQKLLVASEFATGCQQIQIQNVCVSFIKQKPH